MTHLPYILVGLSAGLLSGIMGVGGGIIIVPALVYIFGLTQHQAQGTSLAAMIPPITFLAALRYYYSGNVKVNVALFVALGFMLGGLLGASMIQSVPGVILKRIFGSMMLIMALRMILFP